MIITYKYRLKDRLAKKTLARHAIAVNQVWNYCNAVQKDIEARYRAGAPKRRWPSHFDLDALTRGTSRNLGIHSGTICEVCKIFSISRDAVSRSICFRASSGPRRSLGWIPFKQKSRQINGNSVTYLGKRYRWFGDKRRPLPDNAKGGCFVEDALGRWYVCFHVDKIDDRAAGNGRVGIDLGLKALATCSDGLTVPALRHYRRYEHRLAIAQRAGNKRRTKAIHAKIVNSRKDHLHKASTKIARENELIVVGNVNAAQLGQTRMAKSVYDAGWSMFRNMLRYKASRHGARYIEVDERWTTQLCSACGVRSGPKGIAQIGIREWTCGCGAVHDRDVNAARNILALSAQRRGDESRTYETRIGTNATRNGG
jgi:IS605 OrfB family transposase